jgi:hypothetical protein
VGERLGFLPSRRPSRRASSRVALAVQVLDRYLQQRHTVTGRTAWGVAVYRSHWFAFTTAANDGSYAPVVRALSTAVNRSTRINEVGLLHRLYDDEGHHRSVNRRIGLDASELPTRGVPLAALSPAAGRVAAFRCNPIVELVATLECWADCPRERRWRRRCSRTGAPPSWSSIWTV